MKPPRRKRAWVWLLLSGFFLPPAQAKIGEIIGICVAQYYDVPGGDTPEGKPVKAKLNSIILHGFTAKNEDVAQVVKDLSALSQRLDPDHVGVKIRLDLSHPSDLKNHHAVRHNVILELRDPVCLAEVLAYVCNQTDLGYRIVDDVVVMEPY